MNISKEKKNYGEKYNNLGKGQWSTYLVCFLSLRRAIKLSYQQSPQPIYSYTVHTSEMMADEILN